MLNHLCIASVKCTILKAKTYFYKGYFFTESNARLSVTCAVSKLGVFWICKYIAISDTNDIQQNHYDVNNATKRVGNYDNHKACILVCGVDIWRDIETLFWHISEESTSTKVTLWPIYACTNDGHLINWIYNKNFPNGKWFNYVKYINNICSFRQNWVI